MTAADPCLMPIGLNRLCLLPGDHDGGCDEPLSSVTEAAPIVRCRCSHGPSTHTGGYGKCHIFVCACATYRDKEVQ